MFFGQPQFLWAFALLLLPVIVHLVQFKKHNVYYFPGVFRLTEILKISQKKRNIKRWLLLISRLLAFFCLVLYFADPQWQRENHNNSTDNPKYIVYVDASPSMQIQQSNGVPAQIAKEKALEFISQLPENSQIWVLHDLRQISTKQWINKTMAMDAVRSINTISFPYTIQQIYRAIEPSLQSLESSKPKWIVFSDCFQDFFGGLNTIPLNKLSVSLVRVSNKTVRNFAIDSAMITDGNQKLRVRIIRNFNEANSTENCVVKLNIDNQFRSANVEFEDNVNEKWVEFEIVNISDDGFSLTLSDDAFEYDNVLFGHFPAKSTRPVGYISTNRIANIDKLIRIQPNYFFKLDGLQETVDFEKPAEIQNTGISLVHSLSQSIQWHQIDKWLNNDNRVLIYPYNGNLETLFKGKWLEVNNSSVRLSSQGLNEPLFQSAFKEEPKENAFFPQIRRYFQLDDTEKANLQVHLSLSNGEPLLVSRNLDNGTAFIFLSDSKKGMVDFEKSSWFTPIVTELLLDRNKDLGALYGVFLSGSSLVLPEFLQFNLQRPVSVSGDGGLQLTTGLHLSNGRLSLPMDFDHNKSGLFIIKDEENEAFLGLNIPRRESLFVEMGKEIETELGRRNWNLLESTDINLLHNQVRSEKQWWEFLIYLVVIFFLFETLLMMPWFALKGVNSQNQS